ncbi:MAG: hypothetical protein DHS20C18_52700 [Saprospiraceae bacterium]|nr:MAG: hypothetical protein DHS20C18_52700 [Saprospiraceae bacterium]
MKFFFPILMIFSLWACTGGNGQNSAAANGGEAESPDIQITVAGLPAGTARLIGIFAEQRFLADSTSIDNNGQMVFKKEEPYEAGMYFVLFPDDTNLQLLIDKDQKFKITTKVGNLQGSIKIEGSLDNELLYENMHFEQSLQPRFDAVSQKLAATTAGTPEYQQAKAEQDQLVREKKAKLETYKKDYANSFFTIFKLSGQNPEIRDVKKADGTVDQSLQVFLYRRELWDNVDFSDKRLIRTPVVYNKLNRYIKELTVQHPDSIIASAAYIVDKTLDYPEYFKFFANWITLQYEPTKTKLMDSEAVFTYMIQNYFTYDRAFWSDSVQVHGLQLRAHEMAASLIGKKGPDVRAPGPDGKTYSIADIKAPYIIVYMYDPNCENCMVETPKLVKFYREWKSKGVEVFAIVLNTNPEEWKAYIAKNGMGWINVFDPTNRSIYATYFVDHTPELYVLNPERTIIGKNLKVEQVTTIIDRDKENR